MIIFVLSTVLVVASPSDPGFVRGAQLLAFCDWAKDKEHMAADRASYLSYISGVIDANKTLTRANNVKSDLCLPINFTVEEAGQIVFRWLKSHPNSRELSAAAQTVVSLAIKYPCR